VCNAEGRASSSVVIWRPHNAEAQASDLDCVECLLELVVVPNISRVDEIGELFSTRES
jgi:hypothetical protein